MTKIKLGGLMLALCTTLAGCTIYLDIEESDKGDDSSDDWADDGSDGDPCLDWGLCVDAGVPSCPDGSWDCDCWDQWGNWICGPVGDAGIIAPDAQPWPNDAGNGGGIFPDASPAPVDAGWNPNPGDDAGPGC
jgi:hypothetical protein